MLTFLNEMSRILCDRGYPDYPPRLEQTNLSRTLGYSTATKVTEVNSLMMQLNNGNQQKAKN